MPELPEVETVRRGLEPALVGARITRLEQRRPDLRFALPERFAARMVGQTIERLDRRAKYLLAHLSGGEVLAMHLGMSGRFTVVAPSSNARQRGEFLHAAGGNPAHDHVVLEMNNGFSVTYNDARRFGYMLLIGGAELAGHDLFRDLGPEPLGPELSADYLAAKAKGKKADLKAFLLDQRIIAGIGNIYASEALWRAGLSPERAAACLAKKDGAPSQRAVRLVPAIKSVLEAAIKAGGSTLRDYAHTDGSLGYFQHSFAVYDQAGEPCRKTGCRGTIQRIVQSARATYYCGSCQR